MEPFIGQIQPVGFNFAPRGWALCEGQLLPIAQNTALFSLLGTVFGGDGRTTFGLPDLRGRSIVGVGNGAGLSNIAWGQRGGVETITLTINNLPNHFHTVNEVQGGKVMFGSNNEAGGSIGNNFSSNATNNDGADNNVMGTSSTPAHNTNPTGNGLAFQSRNPYLGIYMCIALVGIFPSRN